MFYTRRQVSLTFFSFVRVPSNSRKPKKRIVGVEFDSPYQWILIRPPSIEQGRPDARFLWFPVDDTSFRFFLFFHFLFRSVPPIWKHPFQSAPLDKSSLLLEKSSVKRENNANGFPRWRATTKVLPRDSKSRIGDSGNYWSSLLILWWFREPQTQLMPPIICIFCHDFLKFYNIFEIWKSELPVGHNFLSPLEIFWNIFGLLKSKIVVHCNFISPLEFLAASFLLINILFAAPVSFTPYTICFIYGRGRRQQFQLKIFHCALLCLHFLHLFHLHLSSR